MNLQGELKKLQGTRLTTLYQNKPFQITQVSTTQIILKTSKEAKHPIPLKEITNAWNYLEKHKKLTRSEVRKLSESEINPTYVMAIFASFPGVKHSLEPIILQIDEKETTT